MNVSKYKLKTGERQAFDFLQKFFCNLNERDFLHGINSARNHIKKNGSYRHGLFFRTLLAELGKSVDWKLAEDLETEFVNTLD